MSEILKRNLYEISSELQQIIDYIEDNGGEINEEIENELVIHENELREKVEAYCNIIQMTSGDIEVCKNEKKRINDLQNTRKNLVDKLKSRILDAVNTFGFKGKSGNKTLETNLYKLYTKNTTTLKLDNDRINTLSHYLRSYINELNREGIFETGESVDNSGLLAAVNALIKADYGDDYPEFTKADLVMLKFNITTEIPFSHIILGKADYALNLIADPLNKIETPVYEDDLKTALKSEKDLGLESKYTIGHLETNTSIVIK